MLPTEALHRLKERLAYVEAAMSDGGDPVALGR